LAAGETPARAAPALPSVDREQLAARLEHARSALASGDALHSLGELLKTVAEHIESTAAWGEVASLGVDYVQGFAAGRAAPLKDLLDQAALFQMATAQVAEHVVLESSA